MTNPPNAAKDATEAENKTANGDNTLPPPSSFKVERNESSAELIKPNKNTILINVIEQRT